MFTYDVYAKLYSMFDLFITFFRNDHENEI